LQSEIASPRRPILPLRCRDGGSIWLTLHQFDPWAVGVRRPFGEDWWAPEADSTDCRWSRAEGSLWITGRWPSISLTQSGAHSHAGIRLSLDVTVSGQPPLEVGMRKFGRFGVQFFGGPRLGESSRGKWMAGAASPSIRFVGGRPAGCSVTPTT